jgi:hypothetical protein
MALTPDVRGHLVHGCWIAPAKQMSDRFSDCSPAEGIGAAVEKQGSGTSRWQLSHQATPLAWVR